MPKINDIEFSNAECSWKAIRGAGRYNKAKQDEGEAEQLWRLHLLDMLAPYCEHDKHSGMRSDRGHQASTFWQILMNESAKWEVEQGY